MARLTCALLVLTMPAADGSAAGMTARKHGKQSTGHGHSHAVKAALKPVELPMVGELGEVAPADGKPYELKLERRGEEPLSVTYRVGDTYVAPVLDQLNSYLRDSHNEEVKTYDPRTFDVLYTILGKLGRPDSVIEVLCGYRTEETNEELRRRGGTNAAKHSQHIQATALDIRVEGISAAQLRDAALAVGAGGVGYYPKGGFIHVDTGSIRKWTFVPHRGRHGKHRRKK